MKATRFTRRGVLAAAAALPAAGQQSAAPPAPTPSTPEEELNAARSQVRSNAEQMSKVPLPLATEPATRFRA